MRGIEGKVIVVTGGAGAVAGSIARFFTDAGANIVLADRNQEAVFQRAESLSCQAVVADIATEAGAKAVMQKAYTTHGHIDGLLCTVGGFHMGKVVDSTWEQFESSIDLNLRTLYLCVHAVLPHMLKRKKGFIAGFSAGPARHGAGPDMALYTASKAAVAAYLKSLDLEMGDTDVRATVVYPMGTIDTPKNRAAMPKANRARWINPDDIAEALLFAMARSGGSRVAELPISPARR